MKRSMMMLLAWGTLIGFSVLGFVLNWFLRDVAVLDIFQGTMDWWWQIPLGLIYGTGTAWLGWRYVNSPRMRDKQQFFAGVVQRLHLHFGHILFISFCAGFGEEVLFRGAIQPLIGALDPSLGIWLTALLFVAIHGYIHPKDLNLSIYGIYMVLVIAGLGYATAYFGLISAISAHFAIDVYLFYQLNRVQFPKPPQPMQNIAPDL